MDSETLAKRPETLSIELYLNKEVKIPIKNYPNPINEN
jgi:hypothetical protein